MNIGTLRPVLPAVVGLLVVSACGLPQAYQAHMQEAGTAYPMPTSLDGDPATTGLLLIDAVGKKALNSLDLAGAVIAPVDNPGAPIIAGSFDRGSLFGGLAGVVVFNDLAPGRYRVLRLRTRNVNMWETVPMPQSDDFIVTVATGEATYFGLVEIRHPMGTTRRDIAVNRRPEREAAAWKLVAARYPDSAWSAVIASASQ